MRHQVSGVVGCFCHKVKTTTRKGYPPKRHTHMIHGIRSVSDRVAQFLDGQSWRSFLSRVVFWDMLPRKWGPVLFSIAVKICLNWVGRILVGFPFVCKYQSVGSKHGSHKGLPGKGKSRLKPVGLWLYIEPHSIQE